MVTLRAKLLERRVELIFRQQIVPQRDSMRVVAQAAAVLGADDYRRPRRKFRDIFGGLNVAPLERASLKNELVAREHERQCEAAMVICIVRGRESLDSDAFADMKE